MPEVNIDWGTCRKVEVNIVSWSQVNFKNDKINKLTTFRWLK